MSATAGISRASVAEIEAVPSRIEPRPPTAAAGDEAAWIAALRRRDGAAIVRLHELLVRAARFEVSRRTAGFPPG